MAMLATTVQDSRVSYPNYHDRLELRPAYYGMLMKALENTKNPNGIINEDIIAKAKASWGRNVDIPVMSPSAAANGTGLACTAVGTEAISNMVNITWNQLSQAFEMQPAKNFQNEIDYQAEFARKYTDCIKKLALAIDSQMYTSLNTVKAAAAEYASSYVGVGNKYGALAADAIQVSLANRGDFFNDIIDINAADDLYPIFDVIMSTNGRSIYRKLFAQGEGNTANTQYAFSDGVLDLGFSNRVTVSAASTATGFILPKGAFGVVSRLRPDCAAGRETSDGKKFGKMFDPTLGMEIGTLEYSACGSIVTESGNALDTTAVREVFQLEVIFGVLTAYDNFAVSGVGNAIRKFDLLTA